MQYGYGGASDERIKTNIKTIENALDKTLLLRGVSYNDIRIEPERNRIGLIAQEVELIIPEVVRTDEQTGLKSIEYQNLVGLLVEAIKEQQKQINYLKNILIKNVMVTFSIEISEIWEHVPRFPKFWEAFRNFRKSGKNLLGGLLRRMITVLLSEKYDVHLHFPCIADYADEADAA
jgi:hypothetical protein